MVGGINFKNLQTTLVKYLKIFSTKKYELIKIKNLLNLLYRIRNNYKILC